MEDDIEKIVEKDGGVVELESPERRGLRGMLKSVTTFLFVLFLLFSMYIFRDYVHAVLLWAEQEPPLIVIGIFTALFTLVSLPFAWGYIVINMAAGYLFGLLYGTLVTLVSATLGVLLAHFIIKLFFSDYVERMMSSSVYSKAVLAVISGPQAFRIVALSRLTPVPFGIQNAVFSISNLPLHQYIVSSMVGSFPCQAVNAYIGSTLRSMEEVLNSEETVWAGWVLLGSQLSISVLIGVFMVRRAKVELNNAMYASQVETA